MIYFNPVFAKFISATDASALFGTILLNGYLSGRSYKLNPGTKDKGVIGVKEITFLFQVINAVYAEGITRSKTDFENNFATL